MNTQSDLISSIYKLTNSLQEVVNTEYFQLLKIENYELFKATITEWFPFYARQYPTLFDHIINGGDTAIVNIILSGHSDKNSGKITRSEMDDVIGKKMCDLMST